MQDTDNLDNDHSIDSLQEDSGMGSISINNEVVATIVAMAAKEVTGVVALASGGIKDDLAGFFGARKDGTVSISEDDHGAYIIGVKLILSFGVQLAKVAEEVQIAVRDQVENMTNKSVSKVNVIVDGIRHPDLPKKSSSSDDD